MLKNGTPASPATAFASSVFPVPGEPTRITPFGMRAPIFVYFCGSFKKSTSSCRSSFSSCSPATSLKVTFFASGMTSVARLLPKFIILFPPPDCRFIMMINTTRIMPIISTGMMLVRNELSVGTS